MSDPMLERIWQARQSLIEKHGSAEAYIDDVIRRDAERRSKRKQRPAKTPLSKPTKATTASRSTSRRPPKI